MPYRQLSAEPAAIGQHHHLEMEDAFNALGPNRANFDLRYIVAAIRSNLWLIGAIMASALAIALIATLLQTSRYTARATMQINDTSARVLGSQQDNADESLGAGTYDTERFLNTQVDVLKSQGLAARVAQRLKLAGNPAFFASQGAPAPAAGTSADMLQRQVAGMLRSNLSVSLPRDSRIVSVSYESANRELSADIANAYVAEFIQSNLQRKYESSAYARNFLSEQLAEAKIKLEASERALNDYARQAGLIRTSGSNSGDGKADSSNTGSVTTASLVMLNAATNEATAKRIQAEARWRSVGTGATIRSTEVVTNATVSGLLSERAKLKAALEEDRATHLDDYPSVQAKISQLAALDRQIQTNVDNIRNSIQNEYRSALKAEQDLLAKTAQLKGETLSEQDRNVKYSLMAREAETNRQVYAGLLERFTQLNALAGVSTSNVYLIDKAEVPFSPSSPNLMKNLLFGLLMGIGLSALVVFVKDQFDDSIRVPEDVEPKLGLPLLGVVPRSHGAEPAEALADPKSPMSESYNSLRSSLLYSTAEGLPHSLLVTSAQPSEGKTTSSHAIATGLARLGKTVLLIDADMRRPSLHRRTGLDNKRGLSTLLTSHESIESVVVPATTENLTLMVAGPIPPSPTELLSNVRIEEILREAQAKFDVVIVDSPPVLGLADAPLIAALVEGVVFVVEADRSRRGSLKTSLRRLRAMRPLILGAVLTKFDPLKSGNRYSEYYGYEYYQYESNSKSE